MEEQYQSPSFVKSRASFYVQCVTEYLVTLLISDAFLAKLLKSLDMADATIGIVSSLMSFAFLIQLATIFLMQHVRNVKKTVILLDTASMLCFMCTYFVPFAQVSQHQKTLLIFVTIGGGFLLKYLQKDLYYKWGHSFVQPSRRGAFTARNETISLATGLVFSLGMGRLVDHYERLGELNTAYLIIGATIGVLAAMDLWMLLLIRPYNAENAVRQQKTLKDVLRNTLGNKNYRHVVLMLALYDFGRYLTIGFLGTFKTQELALSVGTVQLINIGANALRCVFSRPFGKWSDQTSFAHVYRKGMLLAAFSFLLLALTTPKRWWLIICYTVCYNVSMAGTGGNANNMMFSYVPLDYFVQAQAIRASITGTLGFLASLAGSRILSAIQQSGNRLLGFSLYGQQFLAVLSLIILLAAILLNKAIVDKQCVMKR